MSDIVLKLNLEDNNKNNINTKNQINFNTKLCVSPEQRRIHYLYQELCLFKFIL